jgi:hypothetical protein
MGGYDCGSIGKEPGACERDDKETLAIEGSKERDKAQITEQQHPTEEPPNHSFETSAVDITTTTGEAEREMTRDVRRAREGGGIFLGAKVSGGMYVAS